MQEIETDYLIIGSGAMGVAFADCLLTDSTADMVMVVRDANTVLYWNFSNTFVSLP